MSWKHYNTETKKIEVVRTLVGDMEQFGAIVMAEDTWNVILQVSECVPWSRQSRMNTFIDDLLLVLERKENETGDPFISKPYEYIIHIALDPDAQKDTALISVQRKSTYEFVCKDISIPLKKL